MARVSGDLETLRFWAFVPIRLGGLPRESEAMRTRRNAAIIVALATFLSSVVGSFAASAHPSSGVAGTGEVPGSFSARIQGGDIISLPTGVPAGTVIGNLTITEPSDPGHVRVFACDGEMPGTSHLNYQAGATVANNVVARTDPEGKLCVYSTASAHIVYDQAGEARDWSTHTPRRVVDTRTSPGQKVSAGGTLVVPTGLPNSTVLGNVTVTQPDGAGHVRAFACGDEPPNASIANFNSGATVANHLIAHTNSAGELCFYTSSKTHLIFDQSGEASSVATHDPRRALDTRLGNGTKIAAGSSVEIDTGAPGATVVGNLTVAEPAGAGHFRVYPCGKSVPDASHLNFVPDTTVANGLVARANDAGKLCIYTSADAHIVFDQSGQTTALSTEIPRRVLDTRALKPGGATGSPAAATWQTYLAIDAGRPDGALGAPRSPVVEFSSHRGVHVQYFQRGAVFWTSAQGARAVYGQIWKAYDRHGSVNSALGLPLGSEVAHEGGRKSTFEKGTIYWTPISGVAVAVTPAYMPPTKPINAQSTATTAVGVGRFFLWHWKVIPGVTSWTRLPESVRTAGDGGPATQAAISSATTIAADGRGGYYFADSGNNLIRHVNAGGTITTVVGNGSLQPNPSCAYNRPARQVCLNVPHGVSLDPNDGGLIITDSFNQVVTKMGTDGYVRLLAGNGVLCHPDGSVAVCGENGPATAAKLDRPTQARMTANGLYISDSHNRVLLVGRDGILRRVVGTGERGFSGDEGPATQARLWAPADVVPYNGGLLVSDGNNCRLRWVDAKGIIHAFAGYGSNVQDCWDSYGNVHQFGKPHGKWGSKLTGDIGDGRSAIDSRMTVTGFLAVDGNDVYVTDFLNNSVRRISGGIISSPLGFADASVPETDATVPGDRYPIIWTSGLAYDPVRDVVYAAGGSRIARLKIH